MRLMYEDSDYIETKSYSRSKYGLKEADENLKEQVSAYIQNAIESALENDLVENIANTVGGYDAKWAANNYDTAYKQAKDKLIQETLRLLFSNFSAK